MATIPHHLPPFWAVALRAAVGRNSRRRRGVQRIRKRGRQSSADNRDRRHLGGKAQGGEGRVQRLGAGGLATQAPAQRQRASDAGRARRLVERRAAGPQGRPLCLPPRRRQRRARPGGAGDRRRPPRRRGARRSRRLSVAPSRVAGAAVGGDGDLRDPHRHLHRGGDLPRGDRAAAGARRGGDHRRRGHAGGAVRGRPRLGLRRGSALRDPRRLRHARRSPRFRRRRPRPRADGLSRRRLQPLRSRGESAAAAGAGVLPRGAPHALGRRHRLRAPACAALLHRERADVAPRLPLRRTALRRRRPHPGRAPTRRSSSRWRARSARRFPDREIHLATEDNRNIIGLHPWEDGRPLLHTAEWNDDLHNVAHVLATGETEGYYGDFAEHHWEKYARALAEGFAYQGEAARTRDGEPRGRAERAGSRRSPSSTSSRTTTRSATAPTASG